MAPSDFKKPSKQGPIPIINPTSRSPIPVIATSQTNSELLQKPPLTLPSVSLEAKKQQNAFSADHAHFLNPPPSNDKEAGFDVYATPFVPQILKDVNTSQGYAMIETPPLRFLDHTKYASEVLGQVLLPQAPLPLKVDPTVPPVFSNFVPGTYEMYFRSLLDVEIRCQQKENEIYSLYRITAEVVFHPIPNGPADCKLLVPGLREYSPYVEEDDIVELRQLRHQPMIPYSPHPEYSWTGLVYHARASAVVRAKNLLVLKVQGLTPQTAGIPPYSWRPNWEPPRENTLYLNVQFPVPDERYRPMRCVLAFFQLALKAAASNTLKQVDGPGTASTKDFNYWHQSMLFPTEADCDQQANLHLGFFNQIFLDDMLNLEQKRAVENVCLQNYGTVPYIISGPPGTGKTKTLIETALQLLRNVDQVSHILICAPSEPATDTLADRLRQYLAPHELLRLNRSARGFTEVTDELLPYCYVSGSMFALPPFAQLMKYRVVVTSCRDAALLVDSRMTNSDLYAVEHGLRHNIHPFDNTAPTEIKLHWTALLLDEAAQALEPEALLAMQIVAPPLRSPKLTFTPLFVMAGDECQLGPRTSSPKTPLKRSLFARLVSRPVYANHPLARGRTGKSPPPLTKDMLPILRPAFTNLIRNYRSHPAILAVPSSLFYFDTLEPGARNTDALAGWDGWQGRGWPVLFRNNDSPDDLERDGGGWFNKGEANIACAYASRLATFLGGRQQEVCIMSPFRAQVRLLRETARSSAFNLWDANIGPTEAFQGLEHGVVILCVTRSSKRFVEKDKELNWGIIGQPNKMNVALTRAKYGLIIIGNRDVLVDDPHWRTVLDFCYRNGLVTEGYKGKEDFTPRDGPLTTIERELGSGSNGNGTGTVPTSDAA